MDRRSKDKIMNALIYFSAGVTVFILVFIIAFIVIKGLPGININFLTRSYEDKTTYVTVALKEGDETVNNGYIASLGATVAMDDEQGIEITKLDKDSPLKKGVDGLKQVYALEKGDVITKVASDAFDKYKDVKDKVSEDEYIKTAAKIIADNQGDSVRLKVVRPGGGIVPMVITTIYMILLSLAIAAPISILAAIYLNEYASKGRLLSLIHFAIQNLAGIPSIIYGLFGSLFFVQILKFQYSILAGAMTLSIILFPVIITTTEETLKTIPNTYRESSLGLGATKLQTINHVILPNAVPGILVAILLSVGRIVGESAALLLTAGTVAQVPGALFGNSASGATLTIKAYTLMKEENDLTTACAIGIVLLIIIIVINVSSKLITKKLLEKKGA